MDHLVHSRMNASILAGLACEFLCELNACWSPKENLTWDEPPKESIRSAEEIGLRYFIPEIGEVLSKEIFSSQPIPWWEQY